MAVRRVLVAVDAASRLVPATVRRRSRAARTCPVERRAGQWLDTCRSRSSTAARSRSPAGDDAGSRAGPMARTVKQKALRPRSAAAALAHGSAARCRLPAPWGVRAPARGSRASATTVGRGRLARRCRQRRPRPGARRSRRRPAVPATGECDRDRRTGHVNPARTNSIDLPGFKPPLRLRWELAANAVEILAADGRVFVDATRPACGRSIRRRARRCGAATWSPDTAAYDRGLLFAGGPDGVTALDAATGATRWNSRIGRVAGGRGR